MPIDEDSPAAQSRRLLGVSVHHLSVTLLQAVRDANLEADTVSVAGIEEVVIRGLSKDTVCPRDGEAGSAYVDTLAGRDHTGEANIMLSYTSRYKVKDIADTLVQFCKDSQLDLKRTYVWMCCLCLNQHRVRANSRKSISVSPSDFSRVFGERVLGIGHVVAMMEPWIEPQYMSRVWCDFELFTAVDSGIKVSIVMPPKEVEALHESLAQGVGLQQVWRVLMNLDIKAAEASVPADREHIFDTIRNSCGFERLNTIVSEKLRTWIVESSESYLLEQIKLERLTGELAIRLCAQVAELFTDLGLYTRAEHVCNEGFRLCKTASLRGKSCTAQLLANYGELMSKQGHFRVALDNYAQARSLLESLGLMHSDDGAELLRRAGISLKRLDLYQDAVAHYEEAKSILEDIKKLHSPEGADLLRNLGALKFDMGDTGGAEETYMQAMKVLCKTRTISTPSGASLLTNFAFMKHRGDYNEFDVDNAYEIYEEAYRIRVRTGTTVGKSAQWLTQCMKKARSESLEGQVLSEFGKWDRRGSGECPQTVLEQLFLTRGGTEHMEVQRLLSSFGTGSEGMIAYKEFIKYLWHGPSKSEAAPEPEKDVMIGYVDDEAALVPAGSAARGVSVLSWNIQSADYVPNRLEMLPSIDSLSGPSRSTLKQLLTHARRVMIRPADSPTLHDFLKDLPLEKATDFEKAPLTDPKMLQGVRDWLETRKDLWPRSFYDDEGHVAERWCEDYRVRWTFWRRQKIRDWIKDDFSGGKMNPLVVPNSPTIDDSCWNYGLSSADRRFATHPNRLDRLIWVHSDKTATQELPKTGRFDFFKLMVWDMILNKVMEQAVPSEELGRLISELEPLPQDVRMKQVLDRINCMDLVVLTEVPAGGLAGLGDFWAVHAPVTEDHKHLYTYILAKKHLFEEPVRQDFHEQGGATSTRVVGCTLTRRDQNEQIHVVGVHLSGSGYDNAHMAPQLESALQANTALIGDFNLDLRVRSVDWASPESMPKLASMVKQAKRLPLHLGTGNKQRSPFQAQVSKMFLNDFAMKDYALLGERFQPTALHGLISRKRCLPDKEIPSDHAPLSFDLALRCHE